MQPGSDTDRTVLVEHQAQSIEGGVCLLRSYLKNLHDRVASPESSASQQVLLWLCGRLPRLPTLISVRHVCGMPV